MVIAKDRHADRATRLEKVLDDEAGADRTELEQGIAPIGLNFITASMKRSTGYAGFCSEIFISTCFYCLLNYKKKPISFYYFGGSADLVVFVCRVTQLSQSTGQTVNDLPKR